METITEALGSAIGIAEWIMLFLIVGGGLYLVFASRGLPFYYIRHAIGVVAGKHDKKADRGEVSHFQALASVVAATVGLGNISGVAIAIHMGGPGVVFWMWVTAVVGGCIKFYSAGLAVLFRKVKDGVVQGGPMYYMVNGLGKRARAMAVFFSLAGLIGMLPIFTTNQFTKSLITVIEPDNLVPLGNAFSVEDFWWKFIIGMTLVVLTSMVIFGGLRKIARVAAALVPSMVTVYVLAALVILIMNHGDVLPSLGLIFKEAFNFSTAVQGGFWGLVVLGVRRAVFSNESGVGTAPMFHGQSKTEEPVQEGLVAMLGPFIDTLVVCTITALIIIISGSWVGSPEGGIAMTMEAFETLLFGVGDVLLLVLVTVFAISSLFTYSYYGTKCLNFLGGERMGRYYNTVYIISIVFAALATVDLVIGLIDLAFALMAIPNMIAVLWLSPHITRAMRGYFTKRKGKNA